MDAQITIPQQSYSTQQLPTYSSKSRNTSIIGNALWGCLKIGEATVLAVTGVALIAIGAYSAHRIYKETDDFYFAQEGQGNGLNSLPNFDQSCRSISDYLHQKFSYPDKDSTFCQEIGSKPFDQLNKEIQGAALIIPASGAVLGSFGSLYLMLGGIALLGRSFEVYTSTIFGRQA